MQLKNDNGGIILDISEQGLSMQAAKVLEEDTYTQVRFQLSQSEQWVEARGRVAWVSASKQRAGVEFVDLSFEGLVSIKNWISSVASAEGASPEDATCSPLPTSTEPEDSDGVVEQLLQDLITEELAEMLRGSGDWIPQPATARANVEQPAVLTRIPPTRVPGKTFSADPLRLARASKTSEPLRATSKWRLPNSLLLGMMLVFSAIVVIGHVRQTTTLDGPIETVPAGMLPEVSLPFPVSLTSEPPSLERPETRSGPAGFILQVAAVTNQESALSLADLLRQKKLPVFVVKPAAQSLYRVLVGPYSDVESAASGERELRKQGFAAIRKRNTPAR